MIHGKSSSDGYLIHHMEMNPDRFKSKCGGRDHGCVHVLLCVHAYVGVHENRQRSTLGIFLSTLYITSWDRFCFLLFVLVFCAVPFRLDWQGNKLQRSTCPSLYRWDYMPLHRNFMWMSTVWTHAYTDNRVSIAVKGTMTMANLLKENI